MLIYVMGLDFSVTSNSVLENKYPLAWVYLINFKVYCQLITQFMCVFVKYRLRLANMVPTCNGMFLY